MTSFFAHLFTRYPIKTKRFLEIMPGFFSWMLIFFPVWGGFFIPYAVAYFILFFDVYWFYKSFSLATAAFIASKKIRKAEKKDWLKAASSLANFEKISHIIVIPNYTEKLGKLRETLYSIASQTFPRKRLFIVLAMEQREKASKEKAEILIREFEHIFGRIFAAFHPDIDGEIKGKSSNQAFAAKLAEKKLVKTGIVDDNFSTISSVDADSIFDRNYFSYLSFEFLSAWNPHNKFWQSANVFYNNFWRVPAPTRIISFFGSLWRTAVLLQGDRLISNSTYSLSFKLLRTIGFWDTDVIPEDYRIFFKAFYKLKGDAWVKPIFLKTSMDSPHSTSYWKSLKSKYQQEQRWSWGVSDDPLFIKWWLTVPNVPFLRKTIMLYHVLLDHFLWPVNWFVITVAANVTTLVNPIFARTTIGYTLPRLAGFILTSCLIAFAAMIVVDFRNRQKDPKLSKIKFLLFPFEFILLPIVGFFLSTLPALISHTLLMLGKKLEYKVTEKI